MQIIDLQLYLKTVTLTQIFSTKNELLGVKWVSCVFLRVLTRQGMKEKIFHKVTGQQLCEVLCVVFYATMKFSVR